MLHYKIVHHIHGRIRIEVPILKSLSTSDWMKLRDLFKKHENGTPGITDVRANPLTGSLVIHYDPDLIDILSYLKELAGHQALEDLVRGGK